MTGSHTSVFHLAYNVRDLDEARAFYGDVLGCRQGREAPTWVDYDFFGHEISLHLGEPFETRATGRVGEHLVPMPHLGVIVDKTQWDEIAARISGSVEFVIEPQVRFAGEPGEQWTMFFLDPSGNPIEIKGFRDMDRVFAA